MILDPLPLALSPTAPPWGGEIGYRATMAFAFELHILTSGLVSAAGQFGPFCEWFGWMKRDERYDRLARALAKFGAYYFAISSALGFLIITVLLVALWGHFWTVMVRIMIWPLLVELLAFLAQVTLTYTWFYTWGTLRNGLKPLHLALGGMLALASFIQVWMIDIVASYMATPAPSQSLIRVVLNPTSYPLQVHRTVGNLAYLGFAFAALCALLYLRSGDDARRRFLDWAGSVGAILGVGMTLLQPLVGYSYAKELQLHSYASWYRMMLGSLSGLFLWQITLLGLMFLVALLYFARRTRRDSVRGGWTLTAMAVGVLAATLLAALPYQFAWSFQDVQAAGLDRPFWEGGLIDPLGAMFPWKIVALTAYSILAALGIVWYLRAMPAIRWGNAGRREQHYLVLGALLTVAMMVTMGFIREDGRQPDLIYGQMQVQGQQPAPHPSAPLPPP